ncbi:MAG: TRAP transporter small permease [Desulfovibrio sp.]|jgi:TRAP-type C4-dicarboxylate transport system permease small subunit|nr:TRAP transporter small permease [Desulfovibrio sp.]
MKKILMWINEYFETSIISILLVIITVLCTIQVILRYLFSHTIYWIEEFVVYCNVWIGFIGCSYAILKDNNLRVDMSDFIQKSAAKFLKIIADFITFFFYIYMIYCGLEVIKRSLASNQLSPAAEIPVVVLYASLFFGSVFAVIRYIQRVYISFTKK